MLCRYDSAACQNAGGGGDVRTPPPCRCSETAGSGKLRWPAPTALSPCVGPESNRLHALFYQFGGSSNSGLPLTTEGVGGWRCLAVEKLSQVELRAEAWHTEPRSRRQTCIDEVDFDVDAQPEEDPQKGQ